MSTPLLMVPVLVLAQVPAPAPLASPVLRQVQERLEAIPEAFIAGRRGAMKQLVAQAIAEWDRTRPDLRKALPEAELTAMDRQLKAMRAMSPREQAVGALGLSGSLAQHQPASRQLDLQRADRSTMLAWCLVDAGQVERLPGLAEAFKPLMEQDRGQHTLALAKVQEALKRVQDGQKRKQKATCKKALGDLLKLIDQLEKP